MAEAAGRSGDRTRLQRGPHGLDQIAGHDRSRFSAGNRSETPRNQFGGSVRRGNGTLGHLDGVLDESCWEHAERLPLVSAQSGLAPREKGHAMAAVDGTHLYAAFVCYDTAMDSITSVQIGHDTEAWKDDSVELFVTAGLGRDLFHFIVSNTGATVDAIYPSGNPGDFRKEWSSSFTSAVKTFADRWQVETRIPMADIGLNRGDSGLINFCREEQTYTELTAWAPTGGAFAQPQKFGRLLMTAVPCYLARIQDPEVGYGRNQLRVILVNTDSTRKSVRAVVRVVAETVEPRELPSGAIALEPGAVREAALDFELTSGAGGKLSVSVRTADGARSFDAVDYDLPPVKVVRITAPSSFAMTGHGKCRARVHVRIGARAKTTASMALALLARDRTRVVARTTLNDLAAATYAVGLDPASFACGDYVLQAKLSVTPGGPHFVDRTPLTVLPGY